MSLKVNARVDYVPELFDEHKDQVVVKWVLRVVFLDAEQSTPALEKLKHQLAEAESAIDTCKKSPATIGPPVIGEGLVIDEWRSLPADAMAILEKLKMDAQESWSSWSFQPLVLKLNSV